MEKILAFLFSFITMQIILWIIRTKLEIEELKLDKQISEKRISELITSLNIERSLHKAEIERYHRKLSEIQRSSNRSFEIPKGIIEAVRYAMIHNHPDNGGDAEKFILYKNCYDKLTGGR